ncbi:MAG: circularly permuted type 2 ATP-grasp protein, partial [Propionibacteriaceae bacterium]
IRYYLNQEPIIGNVDTWRLEEDAAREEVLDRLDELVVKPVDGSGGKGIVIGPMATKSELEALRQRVTRDPRGWIAQPLVQLSTVPTLIENTLAPRHVDLRPFAVNNGEEVWVLPGGLTRVALPEGELVVNSSQGGGSKDTWVLSPPLHHAHTPQPEPDEEVARAEAEAEAEEQQTSDDDQIPPARRSVVPMLVSRAQEMPPTREYDEQRAQPEQQQQASPEGDRSC